MLRVFLILLALTVALGSVAWPDAGGDARDRSRKRERGRSLPADAVRPAADDAPGQVDGWYIVRLTDRAPDPGEVADRLAKETGLAVSHVYREAFAGFAARIPPGALAAVRRDPDVASVEPDAPIRLAEQTVPTGVRRIEADKNAVADIDGQDGELDVDVAVIDTGIDKTHPDLNVVGGIDCTSTSDAWGTDGYGHGTHVAGIIGARDNGEGVVGVAPGARLWSVKVFTDEGFGTKRTYFCGLEYVLLNAGTIEVANLSLAGAPERKPVDDRRCGKRIREKNKNGKRRKTKGDPEHRLICRVVKSGVTVVVAAGNDGIDAARVTPAAYDQVITVSALDDDDGTPAGDAFARFSNFGGDVDLAAPGVKILSTMPGGGYGVMSGTSAAAPHVAGAAALYLAANPDRGPGEVLAALRAEREARRLPGDRDGRDEGVVNVNDGPPWPGS